MAQKKRIALKKVRLLEPRFASAITQLDGLMKRNFPNAVAVELEAQKGAGHMDMVVHNGNGETQSVVVELVGGTLVVKP